MISREEAALVFKKWLDERTPLRVVAHLACGVFGFDCRIFMFSPQSIMFELRHENDMCTVFLAGFTFDFKDPRSEIESSEMMGGHTYSSGIMGRSLAGELLAVMEIADEH